MTFISEGDLYRLITHSKMKAAEKFESWVFDEVLPTIRKTGSYNPNPTQYRIKCRNFILINGKEFTKEVFSTSYKEDSAPCAESERNVSEVNESTSHKGQNLTFSNN
jgi:prophage antirepressor-like protein